jgi:sigma-B regulation protein RsbU (phosphoserine phosphatase)
MFVTLFVGILDTVTGEMVYTNAGHNPTYIRKADGNLERLDNLHGPVVGAKAMASPRPAILKKNSLKSNG